MQFDERILELTPIHRRLGGGIDTSDSEASLLGADEQLRFDPHTPLHPKPAANTIRRDISTPIDPYAAKNFLMTPAEERARANLSTAASPGSSSAWQSCSGDSQEGEDDEGKDPAARRPFTPQRSATTQGPARTPRSAPRSTSTERRLHRGETSGRRRRRRMVHEDDDEEAGISAEELEPMLHSLHKLTRELRKALAREAGAPRFSSPSSYAPPAFGFARGGAAHTPAHPMYGQRGHGYSSASPRSHLGGAFSYASPSYSLNTRLQLAAASSRAHGSYGQGAPVHTSSFSHAGSHFLLTVNSFG